MAHTPGPWHVEPWEYKSRNETVLTVQTKADAIAQLCNLWPPDERANEQVANARLIAAAPELLEACRAFVHWYNVDSTELNRDEAFYAAQAAIAKAEGG